MSAQADSFLWLRRIRTHIEIKRISSRFHGSFLIESTLFWIGAIGLGLAHAFEPDHMAAVSTFVAGRPSPRAAALFGFKWAIGHSLSLLVFGTVLYLLKRAVNQPALFASGGLDRFVGLVLLALGVWMAIQLRTGVAMPTTLDGWKAVFNRGRARRGRTLEEQLIEQQTSTRRAATSDDLPMFGAPGAHATRAQIPGQNAQIVTRIAPGKTEKGNASLWMGVLHGAAGTGAFVGQAAVSLSQSYAVVLVYTLLFSVGVLVAMSFYAGVLGGVLTWGEQRGAIWLRRARWVTSLATCAIGICLMLGVELPGLFG